MGFLSFQRKIGWVSGDLRKHGRAARGTSTGVEESALKMGDAEAVPTVDITLMVTLDGEEPYEAAYRHTIQRRFLDQLVERKDVAVRVNPKDHSDVAIDMEAELGIG